MNKSGILFIILLLLFGINLYSQQSKLDSLRIELTKPQHDTIICKLYLDIGFIHEQGQPDSAIYYYNKSLMLAEKKGFKPQQADALRYLGIIYRIIGESDKALECYKESLEIGQELNNDKIIAAAYNSIGLLYYNLGLFDMALENFLEVIKMEEQLSENLLAIIYNNIGICFDNLGLFDKAIENHINSLRIREKLGDKSGIADSYTNIGGIHHNQNSHDNALEYYLKAMELYTEIDDRRGLARSYNNIGLVYRNKGESKKAIDYHLKAIPIREEQGDIRGLFISYNNIGSVYRQMGQYMKALEYYEKAQQISTELGDKHRMSIIYNSSSNLYIHIAREAEGEEKEYYLQMARELSHKAFDLAIETGSLIRKCYAANILRIVYTMLGEFEEALKYAEIYIAANDSVYNQEKLHAVADAEKKFQAEKKQLQIEKLEKEKTIQQTELLRQQEVGRMQMILILIIVFGLATISVFLVIVRNRLKTTRKQKAIIEEQKMLVDEKNIILNEQNEEIRAQHDEIEHQRDEIATQRDMVVEQKEHIELQKNQITNSITYAQLIQNAVLPSQSFVEDVLGEHFIIYKPKDIVSGDFFWITKVNNMLVFTVADCTGHGVPGAFMSMLGLSFLKELVGKKGITNPAEILEHLRDDIIEALQQKGKSTDQREGMDMAFCVLNVDNNVLHYAGANIALTIVKPDKEFDVIHPDKQPVAYHRKMKPFNNKEIQLAKGDCVYLASDGYQNQLGGENYKMFMSKNLRSLLADISDKQMDQQKDLLTKSYNHWKGPHEQVDDVTILGVRV